MPLAAAIRIVSLEHQVAAAHQRITELQQSTDRTPDPCEPGTG
jgi:hypothetical protein